MTLLTKKTALSLIAAGACALIGWSATAQNGPPRRPSNWNSANLVPMEEHLVSDLSRDSVPITVQFSGSDLLVYGAVRRDRFLWPDEPPPDIAISVTGPATPVTVRRKRRVAGVWTNGEFLEVSRAPRYYAVASTRPLNRMLRPNSLAQAALRVQDAVKLFGSTRSVNDPEAFRQAVIRVRKRQGLYSEIHEDANGDPAVKLLEGTLFRTAFRLPANIAEGDFEVRVLLARRGRIIDEALRDLPVRRAGLERDIHSAAQNTPALYGLISLLAALAAGWGAAEAFRRLRSR